jgi:plasmid stabilization system protein ParE
MKLRFTPRAVANLAEIVDYIQERNPVAALRLRAAIYESLRSPALS